MIIIIILITVLCLHKDYYDIILRITACQCIILKKKSESIYLKPRHIRGNRDFIPVENVLKSHTRLIISFNWVIVKLIIIDQRS